MSELIYLAGLPAAGLAAGTLITYLIKQKKINEMDTQVEELEDTVNSQDKKIKSLNKNLNEEKITNKGLTEELNKRDLSIKNLEEQVENRGQRLDTLTMDIAELRMESDETISQRDSTIESLEAEVERQDQNIETLNVDFRNQKRQNHETMSQRDFVIRARARVEMQLKETNEHVEVLNTQVANLEQQNQETTDRAISAETRISELDNFTSELEHEIISLKAKQRAMQDDFSRLDGIGPKIASVLRSAGVKTFAKLAAKETDEIREILAASNPSLLKLSDPTSWPEQAGRAAEGEWESLKTLQENLKEARRQEREAPLHQPETDATHLIIED
jgi:predicted flap endonuclease-1-like 5' DNA nuclease